MRPRRLSIEGLNSFIERQTIDFDRLTAKGFFGIFGPTGSGKSSILDGITLALYGRIARGSAEFVNKQVDTLSLSYEFSLGSQYFKVEREIKRNKNGEIRTAYAKLTELTSTGEVVLEDKASSVSKRCEDIIGLSVDDFSRTVVLPQGKFSEFLKLPNGQRREMLERIFNLEAYGAALSTKVAKHLSQVKAELSVINGQLMGYEDLSQASLMQLDREILDINERLTQQAEALKIEEAAYSEAKVVFERFNHLKQTEQLLNEHLKGEDAYRSNTKRLDSHEAAVAVMPYWQAFESTLGLKQGEQQRFAELEQRYEGTQRLLKESEQRFEGLMKRLETEIPSLKARLDLLKEGRKDIELLMQDKAVLDGEKQLLADLEKEGLQLKEIYLQASTDYEAIEKAIQNLETELEMYQVPEQYKAVLRKCLTTEEHYDRVRKNQEDLERLKQQLTARISDYNLKCDALDQRIKVMQSDVQQVESALVALNETYGKQQLMVSALQVVKEKLHLLIEQKTELESSLALLPKFEDPLPSASQQLQITAFMDHETQQSEWLTYFKEQYHREAFCPVCGQASQAMAKRKLEERLLRLEEQWQAILNENDLLQHGLGNIGEEALLLIEAQIFKAESAQQESWQRIKELEASGKALANDLNQGMQQRSGLSAESAMTRLQLEELAVKLDLATEETLNYKKEMTALKNRLDEAHKSLDLSGVRALVATIEENEQKSEILKANQKTLRGQLEALKAQKESAFLMMNERENALQVKRGAWDASFKHYQDQKEKLSQKLGPLMSVKSESERLEAELQTFETSYQQEKVGLQALTRDYQTLQSQYIELLGRLKDLEHTAVVQQSALKEQLSQKGFSELAVAKEALLSADLHSSLKVQTRDYQRRLDELKGTYEALKDKLAHSTFDLIAFQALSERFEALKANQIQTQQQLAKLQLQYQQTQQRLIALGELVAKREQIEVKQAQLQDLAKLFEARKFVAFIASTQMAYISGKASEQLLEMTQGSYGIEAQADGSFLVRDYKNGGVTRDVSTLSGGETFLVSLALALALSAQVQLKGKAPLELFFLDEGFGTLDDETLEVVLAALENLSHEKLSIGLISHVEAIKNRVPIKLMVTPAKAGMGGSKVKIELS